MKVSFAVRRPRGSYALAIPVWGEQELVDRLRGFDEAGRQLALRAAEAQRFERELAAIAETFVAEGEVVRRLLLIGLGGKRDDEALFERAGGALTARLLTSGETKLVIDISESNMDSEAAVRIAFGAVARSWRYDIYRTKQGAKTLPTLKEIIVVGGGADADHAWRDKEALLEGIFFTRALVTEPANVIFPVSFVERCQTAMEGLGVEFEILDEPAMRALNMGALLGVSLGSSQPPRLLAMRWNGSDPKDKPIVFIGKGVTFDSGGISIKPAAGMEAMKWDMGGAAAVAGAMLSLATRKARANVVGICGLVENMPDGKAQRPGDVVTSMSGQTIEVINTDAEGRLVLCDALTWAQRKYKPQIVIDLATLTGAMIVSLGHEYGGLFSNDDGLAAELSAAGLKTGDRLWRLPMGEVYDKMMDSPIADMKNSGPREGGSITAACFLGRFIEQGVKWAHLDVAGMVWSSKAGHLYDKGATGYGAALLDRYIAVNHEGPA